MDRGDLTEAAWQQLRSLLPTPRCGGRGRPRRDDRTLLNGMRWILRTGAPWRDLPARFGPWQTVYHRFTTWRRDRKSTRLNSSHGSISYAVFCLKKKKKNNIKDYYKKKKKKKKNNQTLKNIL